jgi:hypothetical protein
MIKKKITPIPVSEPKFKGTVGQYIASLTPQERKEFDDGYTELLISEMIIAASENNETAVKELAKRAHLAPKTVQNLRLGMSSASVRSLIEVFKSLVGYSIFAEKGNEKLPLAKPRMVKDIQVACRSPKPPKIKEKPTLGKREIEELRTIPRMARRM